MSEPVHDSYSYRDDLMWLDDADDAEQLPALEAQPEVCKPGERLWLRAGRVVRYWLKGRGKRARWSATTEDIEETERWITAALDRTVLARLRMPGRCNEYALEPGLEEKDLAVLDNLEQMQIAAVWGHPYVDTGEHLLMLPDWLIRQRIHRLEADLQRMRALRARYLQEMFGTDEEALQLLADALHIDLDAAHEIMAARESYYAWVRAEAARSREMIPVRKPSGPTGLPDAVATLLMTAACETETVFLDRSYPRPLPAELVPWHVYVETIGHCIAVAVEGVYTPGGDPWRYMTVAPVRMVLAVGWSIHDGRVVAPIPFNTKLGAAIVEDEDIERWAEGDIASPSHPDTPGNLTQ